MLWDYRGTDMSDISKTAAQVNSRVSEITENVAEASRAAGKKLEDSRKDAAAALQGAAGSVREAGRQTADKIEDFTTGVADKLDATGSFLRKHDLKTVGAKVRRFATGRQSLVAAIGLGFIAGFALRQMTHACPNARR
jgi:hypothetical protein